MFRTSASVNRHRSVSSLQWAWRWLATALACWAAGRLGHAFPDGSPLIAAWGPQAGVALAALFRWGAPCAVPVFAAALLGNLLLGLPGWLAAGCAAGSTAGPWLAAQWLERAGFHRRLEQRRDLWLLIVAGALGGALLSAANGAGWLAAAGRISPLDLPRAWFHWWLGDSLGVFVAGVPLLTIGRRAWRRAFAPDVRAGTATLLLGSAAAVVLAFALRPLLGAPAIGLLLLPPVLLSWLAMRSGIAVASSGVLLIAAGIGLALDSGTPALMAADAAASHALLWTYLMALMALVLAPHVLIGELARLEERWQLALVGSDLGVADWNLRSGDGFTSPRWRALQDDPSGVQTATIARWLARVHPDDRTALDAALAPLLAAGVAAAPGAGLRHEARLRVHDGWRWFDVHLTVVDRDLAGAPLRVVAAIADIGARRSAEEQQ